MNRDLKTAGIPLSIEGKYCDDASSIGLQYIHLGITNIIYSGKLNLDIDDKVIFKGIIDGIFTKSGDYRSGKFSDDLGDRGNPYKTINDYNQTIKYCQNKVDDIKQRLAKTKNYNKSKELAKDLDYYTQKLNSTEASAKSWKDYVRQNPNKA